MSHQSLSTIQMQAILADVAARRSHSRRRNLLAVLGVLFLAMTGGLVTVALYDPAHAAENISSLTALLFWIVLLPLAMLLSVGWLTVCVLILVPLILFFHSRLVDMRRRMMLSLIQTAMETGTSPVEMIRAHAAVGSRRLRNTLNRIAQSLERGHSLAVALSQTPGLARYDVCGILSLGSDEKQTLKTLDEISRDPRNRTLTESAGIFRVGYLLSLLPPLLAVVIFMMLWIIPQFMKIFDEFGVELPRLTLAIIAITKFFIDFWYLLAPLVPAVIFLLICFLLMQSEAIAARPPGLRRMFRNIDAARFLRIFSTGLKNQVPVPDSVQVYQRVVTSAYLKDSANRINKKITGGGSWIEAFREAGMITAGESRLLEAAQRAGNLPAVVDQIARSKELKHSASGDLVSKFVFIPSLLLIGTLIGLFVVGMFLPMVELVKAMS